MKPALAENVEEKERKHGGERKSHNNLCPDSQHGAKLPTRRPWLQAPPKSTRQECSQPGHPGPVCPRARSGAPGRNPPLEVSFAGGTSHFEGSPSGSQARSAHCSLFQSCLWPSILLPWYFTHQIDLIMVLKLKGTTWILVTLTYTRYFPCYICKQEPSGFSYHCYFSKAAQSNFPGTDIKFCSMDASVCGYRDVYAYEEFLQNN